MDASFLDATHGEHVAMCEWVCSHRADWACAQEGALNISQEKSTSLGCSVTLAGSEPYCVEIIIVLCGSYVCVN